jgi:hypothetical protein
MERSGFAVWHGGFTTGKGTISTQSKDTSHHEGPDSGHRSGHVRYVERQGQTRLPGIEGTQCVHRKPKTDIALGTESRCRSMKH